MHNILTTIFSGGNNILRAQHTPSRIAARGAYHREDLRALAGRLARVSPGEEELEKVAEELQRDVLERERRAVEELEDELVVAELGQRGDVGMAERGGVGSADDRAEVVGRELIWGDVELEDGDGEVEEGVGLPLVLPVGGQGGNALRDVQATVGGETGQDGLERAGESANEMTRVGRLDLFEAEQLSPASSGKILHRVSAEPYSAREPRWNI